MARREYFLTLTCAHKGCGERQNYVYDRLADRRDADRRYARDPWKCIRHASPERNLRPDHTAVQGAFIATEKFWTDRHGEQQPLGLFWVQEGAEESGNGFNHSSVHTAYADDFQPGTRLVITAYVETPEQAEVAVEVDGGCAVTVDPSAARDRAIDPSSPPALAWAIEQIVAEHRRGDDVDETWLLDIAQALRALAGASSPDVATLLAACDELDRIAEKRRGEIERGERRGPPIVRAFNTLEIRHFLGVGTHHSPEEGTHA